MIKAVVFGESPFNNKFCFYSFFLIIIVVNNNNNNHRLAEVSYYRTLLFAFSALLTWGAELFFDGHVKRPITPEDIAYYVKAEWRTDAAQC